MEYFLNWYSAPDLLLTMAYALSRSVVAIPRKSIIKTLKDMDIFSTQIWCCGFACRKWSCCCTVHAIPTLQWNTSSMLQVLQSLVHRSSFGCARAPVSNWATIFRLGAAQLNETIERQFRNHRCPVRTLNFEQAKYMSPGVAALSSAFCVCFVRSNKHAKSSV